jgi:hypothetical protein
MGRALGHSPSSAGAAESAFLATEGQDDLVLAVFAANAQEPVSQDPAAKEGLEFLGDMFGKAFSLGLGHGLEDAEVAGDGLVEDGFLRPAGLIRPFSESLETELSAGAALSHGPAALQRACQVSVAENPSVLSAPLARVHDPDRYWSPDFG